MWFLSSPYDADKSTGHGWRSDKCLSKSKSDLARDKCDNSAPAAQPLQWADLGRFIGLPNSRRPRINMPTMILWFNETSPKSPKPMSARTASVDV